MVEDESGSDDDDSATREVYLNEIERRKVDRMYLINEQGSKAAPPKSVPRIYICSRPCMYTLGVQTKWTSNRTTARSKQYIYKPLRIVYRRKQSEIDSNRPRTRDGVS